MLRALSGAAAVGARVIRVGPATPPAVQVIVIRPGVEVPVPAPLATRPGRVASAKLAPPTYGVAWALVAKANARPAAEMNDNNFRILELLFLVCVRPRVSSRGPTVEDAIRVPEFRELDLSVTYWNSRDFKTTSR
jgi:hypothetical protein